MARNPDLLVIGGPENGKTILIELSQLTKMRIAFQLSGVVCNLPKTDGMNLQSTFTGKWSWDYSTAELLP